MARPGIELQGAKELRKLLKHLPDRVARKVLRAAVNKAATPIVKSARRKASKESGTLRKSMGKKLVVNKKTGSVMAIIGPRREVTGEFEGKQRVPANYAHLVEDGHIAADGSHVPAKPFLRPAYDEGKGPALETIKAGVKTGVVNEAKKLSKRK